MKPAPFTYDRPASVDEAVDALAASDGDAKLLAGGQSLIPMMNTRLAAPESIVDINGLSELDYVEERDGAIAIGALTRQATVESSDLVADKAPLVAEALTHVGHQTIRHRGTVGGNLAHSDPTSELPAVARALDAEFRIRGSDGERTVSAEEFFVGYMTTDVGPDELLTEVRFPVQPEGQGWAFTEMAPREGDYALVGVAATLDVDGGTCESAALAYTAVSDRPIRVPEAEAAIEGEPLGEDTFETVGAVARDHVDPPSDVHGSTEYRKHLVESLTRRALTEAADRAEGGD
ncbi:MAG: xanthine dehydrogenase family protein subunit M [Salinigranum sp.]